MASLIPNKKEIFERKKKEKRPIFSAVHGHFSVNGGGCGGCEAFQDLARGD